MPVNSQPTISVALCTFNGERFIEEQVRSILGQSVQPDEIVVADDGSRDRSVDRVRAVLANSSVRCRVLPPSPLPHGVVRNFERAVQECHGDIVLLSDQDDVWHPDRVARVRRVFQEVPSTLLVACDARLIDADGRELAPSMLESMGVAPASLNQTEVLRTHLRRSIFPGMAMAIRGQFARSLAPIPDSWMHDYWWAVGAALRGGFYFDSVASVDYRQHSLNAVGARPRGFVRRIRKALRTPSNAPRYARMFDALLSRVLSDPDLQSELDLVRRKAEFELGRASLSSKRVMRARQVTKLVLAHGYRDFSANGALNAVRDLVVRASVDTSGSSLPERERQ